mmetsp:Transcript_28419/g.44420  ORF Transcript_28419/g.44420 Transcript_28419/m.44420 type:complete len:92 (+) Transcript_28419:1088-1363(+)
MHVNINEAPKAVRDVFLQAAPAPGDGVLPPPETFPTDRRLLTQVEIGFISRWYNDDFGIREGDNADDRTRKFHDFLCDTSLSARCSTVVTY